MHHIYLADGAERIGSPEDDFESDHISWVQLADITVLISHSETLPRAVYVRALEYVTGKPVASLGFDTTAERYGLDPDEALATGSGPWIPVADPKAQPGPLTGVCLSRYEYESTGRGARFTSHHYVAVVQHGTRLQVRSTPGSRSRLLMDLTANGQVLTGTWTEETNPSGYYQGAVYHGAIQLLLEPTGRKMTGKWVGFGRDFDLST